MPNFCSQIIADIGISFGDEGKGRLVYELIDDLKTITRQSAQVAVVLKVNGGANSGHTAGGLKLNLLPAGVIAEDVGCLALGSGVVADPRKLWWEIRPLEAEGYTICKRLAIDERTQVSDLTHRLLDLAWEYYRQATLGESPRGSTGRGISPAYADEANQSQIFYSDFLGDKTTFATKMRHRIDRALRTIKHVCQVSPEAWEGFFNTLTNAEQRANQTAIEADIFPSQAFDFHLFQGKTPFALINDAVIDSYWHAGSTLAPHIADVREIIQQAQAQGRYVIGEFGQSYWLDKRHGFPPNVTASHTFTPELFQSAGLPVQPIHTIGVCKAYDTKVGTHHFLTAMPKTNPLAVSLRQLEYGTATGRQREVGWFDAVEKGDVLRYGGFEELAINKLDALTCTGPLEGIELLIATAYRGPDRSPHQARDGTFGFARRRGDQCTTRRTTRRQREHGEIPPPQPL